jgi:hypothetical protein
MSVKMNIRLPDGLHVKIQETASAGGQTATAVMVRALERGLEAEGEPRARYAVPAPRPAQAALLPAKPFRTLENLQRAGILKPASELTPPLAVLRPFCPRCSAEIIRKPGQTVARCRLCGHLCQID